MRVPQGSIVTIDKVGSGVLAEDVNINLTSSYKSMFSDLSERASDILNAVTVVGTVFRSISGRGFAGQAKQMTTQMWDKTEPASFNINVEFHRVPLNTSDKKVSSAAMMATIKRFCSLPLPGELKGGILSPPGPSYLEGLGIDQLVQRMVGNEDGVSADQAGVVDVFIGSMQFRRLLMKKAEPTFNKYVDEDGYPVSCRVNFEFVSLWAATKSLVGEW